MASFSLEYDGIFSSQSNMEYVDDPFVNAGIMSSQNHKPSVPLDNVYSDISDDDDFEIPSSQYRLPARLVLLI